MGLTRFDGSEFVNYSSSNTTGWDTSDIVARVCTDSEGTLWFSSGNSLTNVIYTLEYTNQSARVTRPLNYEAFSLNCLEENKILIYHVDAFTLIDNKNSFTTYEAPGLQPGTNFRVYARNDTLLYTLLGELHYRVNDQHNIYEIPASAFKRSPQNTSIIKVQVAVSEGPGRNSYLCPKRDI